MTDCLPSQRMIAVWSVSDLTARWRCMWIRKLDPKLLHGSGTVGSQRYWFHDRRAACRPHRAAMMAVVTLVMTTDDVYELVCCHLGYVLVCWCVTCSDQFARAFHKGSRPGSALSGNVPSPISHLQEPQYGNYADEQFYKGPQVMPEGQDWQYSILSQDWLFWDTELYTSL